MGLLHNSSVRLSKTVPRHNIVSLKTNSKLYHFILKYQQNVFYHRIYNWLLINPFALINVFF